MLLPQVISSTGTKIGAQPGVGAPRGSTPRHPSFQRRPLSQARGPSVQGQPGTPASHAAVPLVLGLHLPLLLVRPLWFHWAHKTISPSRGPNTSNPLCRKIYHIHRFWGAWTSLGAVFLPTTCLMSALLFTAALTTWKIHRKSLTKISAGDTRKTKQY